MGGFYVIMDIIQGTESGLVLKTFAYHKGNLMSIKIRPTNINVFGIGSIDFNERVWDICNIIVFQNHVGHEYYSN